MYKFGKSSANKLATVKSDLAYVMYKAMELMNKRRALDRPNCDFGITHGLRTTGEQAELYMKGRTRAGSIVTNCDGITKRSKHQDGEAVDVIAYLNGHTTYDKHCCELIALCVLQAASELNIKVKWGGFFSGIDDACHFELFE